MPRSEARVCRKDIALGRPFVPVARVRGPKDDRYLRRSRARAAADIARGTRPTPGHYRLLYMRKQIYEPPENRWSSPPMDIRNSREVISALSASRVGIGYRMVGGVG
ncbi:hypothetical protein EVAR_96665_1 [Eumeta japonica]|uniref:Uncharacterized protein n=1 Tax=Eumeta variegata TaxID=151549 RepID=A0A4C1WJB9_EUMVA|nr:hypothetical protein EVAR_96665_1 [Eumeta japonica]